MALKLATPVTLADLLAVLAPERWCLRLVWDVVQVQLARGPSWAIRDEAGAALVVGGVFPCQKFRECWWIAAPAASARLPQVLRQTRLTLRELCQIDRRPVITLARTAAGAVIARRLGFQPCAYMPGLWRLPTDEERNADGRFPDRDA